MATSSTIFRSHIYCAQRTHWRCFAAVLSGVLWLGGVGDAAEPTAPVAKSVAPFGLALGPFVINGNPAAWGSAYGEIPAKATVSIRSPQPGALIPVNSNAEIVVSGFDPELPITNIEIYDGIKLIGKAVGNMGSISWTPQSAAERRLTVRAMVGTKAIATAAIPITVVEPSKKLITPQQR